MNYQGIIVEESLEDKSVLEDVQILSTKVENVVQKHKTPWLLQWTLHKVEILEDKAKEVAEKISKSLDQGHDGSWYADFKNDTHHYIVFRDKVFCIDRTSKEQYNEAKQYGLSLGIPEYQLDFSSFVKEWKR